MTDPNETNEEINEELSTDELKSVSGGAKIHGKQIGIPSLTVNISDTSGLIEAGDADFRNPKAAGSGMTVQDWNRANRSSFNASTTGSIDSTIKQGK